MWRFPALILCAVMGQYMDRSIFRAHTQHQDFTGSVSADISEEIGLINHLVSLGKASEEERVIAFRITSKCLDLGPVEDVSLVAYVGVPEVHPKVPKEVRAVELRLTPGEALTFFKKFDLVATSHGIDLRDADVDDAGLLLSQQPQ